MLKKSALISMFALLFLAAAVAVAQDSKEEMKNEAAQEMAKGEHVTLEGTLTCVGCGLKASEGARSSCSVFGHTFTLKTEDGKYISLLLNKFSADLLKGEKYHNKAITVEGTYYANANQLDVESFTVDGKMMSWCTKHEAMDGCMASMKGN